MDTSKTFLRVLGNAHIWHGVEVCIMSNKDIERFQPDHVFVNPMLNEMFSPDKMFERLMELSLTHKLSEIGITTMDAWPKAPSMEYKDIIAIKLLVAPLERGESNTNVTPEFVDTVYGKLKEPWKL